MQIVIYNQENKIVEHITDKAITLVEDNNIRWVGGGMDGIHHPFLILSDDVVVSDLVDDDLAELDQAKDFKREEPIDSIAERLESMELAILTLMDARGVME